MRDYAPIFSAIRPQTPFASILLASAQRPTRELMRLGIQLSAVTPQDARPSSEFRRTEKSDWPPASVARPRRRTQSQPCKHCGALTRRRSFAGSRLEPHPPLQVDEARVAADWIPHGLVFIKDCNRS